MPVRVSRILHAGYVFECVGTRIAFDPIFENPFSRNCHAFPDVRFDREQIRRERFAAVFISHYHDDHCSFESLDLLDRETPICLYCVFDELFDWLRELGFRDVQSLQLGEAVRLGPFEVTPWRALDADVDSIFQIRAEGLNILNVVDSWIDPAILEDLERRKPWDLVLWPFQTMRELEVLAPSRASSASRAVPPEWLEQLRALNPSFVVPSSCQFAMESWSWYNRAFFPITYRQFEREVVAILPAARIVRMNPSVSFLLRPGAILAATPLPWVIPVGEQDVDYRFDASARPPPTAEIARHFPALTDGQTAMVFDYCRNILASRYASLVPVGEPYFDKPRLWRLSLFDHAGEETRLHYWIEGGALRPARADEGPLAWTTEVPIARLHGALAEGESLTSMYVRINDHAFEPAVEHELADADLMEDPLLRCLFTGVFGAYQLAQLRRLTRAQAKLPRAP